MSTLFVVMPAVVIRQRKPFRRKDGVILYFEGEYRKSCSHSVTHDFV